MGGKRRTKSEMERDKKRRGEGSSAYRRSGGSACPWRPGRPSWPSAETECPESARCAAAAFQSFTTSSPSSVSAATEPHHHHHHQSRAMWWTTRGPTYVEEGAEGHELHDDAHLGGLGRR